MIEKYEKNSASIRKAFDHLLLFLGIDDYEDLPIVYRKAVDQLSNIEMYLSQLVNECDNLRTQKEILKSKIAFLSDKKKSQGQDKTSFIEDKQNIVDKLTKNIQNVEEDIDLLKNKSEIDSTQRFQLQKARNKRAIEGCGGKDSNFYKTRSRKVFMELAHDFKEYFEIPRYDALRKEDFDKAIEFVDGWYPSVLLKREIDEVNAQTNLDI